MLDEINQLYFERRGLLLQLAGSQPPDAAEALRLQLRAAELQAGLDGWTGGWFGEQSLGFGEQRGGKPSTPTPASTEQSRR